MTTHNYDVVVIGAGGSGLAAALSSADAGVKVLVLERRPQPGGTTGIAVGSFTASETRFQASAKIEDRVAWHAEDAGEFADPDVEARNNDELRRFFLENAAETLHWLADFGLSFFGPSAEPPNRVARMHNVVPGAKAYIARLQLELQKRRVPIWCDVQQVSLIRSDRCISGVRCRIDQSDVDIMASRGVVLAGGDYANNPELIARFKGERFREIEGINTFAQGEGHLLAEQAGAELVNMDVTYGPELRFIPSSRTPFQQWLPTSGLWSRLLGFVARRLPASAMNWFIKRLLVTWQHPENALLCDGAILVNQAGQRFVNELQWPDREVAVAAQPQKQAYLLLDRRLIERYSQWPNFISTAPDIAYAYVADYERLRPDVTVRADDLAGVATARGINPTSLQQTVEDYNRLRQSAQKCEFGRTVEQPLENGPWVLMGPLKAYFTTTEGGARIDQHLRVLDAAGEPIPGLYAVGQNGLGGMVLFGHGLHIAWAMTSGRLVGREFASAEKP